MLVKQEVVSKEWMDLFLSHFFYYFNNIEVMQEAVKI